MFPIGHLRKLSPTPSALRHVLFFPECLNARFLFQAADFIAATAASHALSSSFPIHRVEAVTSPTAPMPGDQPQNMKLVIVGILLMLVVGILLGVLVSAQRKKATGITWFPEGFFGNNTLVFLGVIIEYGSQRVLRRI